MLQLSRRRDDIVSVSPASKSVASTLACIALDHMNFGGHVTEASISTKCRYFGKVMDFFFFDNYFNGEARFLQSCSAELFVWAWSYSICIDHI